MAFYFRIVALFLFVSLLFFSLQGSAEQLWIDGDQSEGVSEDFRITMNAFADMAEAVSPSVVNISTFTEVRGHRHGQVEVPLGHGSGFIINPEGFILTNNHVIEKADTIMVKLSDRREFDARVIGLDPLTDVALIKINLSERLPFAKLGISEQLRVGEWVVAIGNPLGLEHSVTAGIVSALKRHDLQPGNRPMYSDFIQTDASINPGNSGGPLLNSYGEVIGINTAVNLHGQGIGFAIPIDMVKMLLPALESQGYIVRSWLGVRIQELDFSLAQALGLEKPRGALVTEVVIESPAYHAGLLPGDIIVEFNGTPIEESGELPWLASMAGVGSQVNLSLYRKGEVTSKSVVLEKLPNQTIPQIKGQKESDMPKHQAMGVAILTVDEEWAVHLGMSKIEGVVIVQIASMSPARNSGLREGDVVVQIGDSLVNSAEEFEEIIASYKPGEIIRFRVSRKNHYYFLAFIR